MSRGPNRRLDLLVAAAFLVTTVVLTLPISLHLSTAVARPDGDPLLNIWVLAWEAHSLATGQLADFFNANIFHPSELTLAYSELLLPQSLLGAPIYLISDNPVLAYNLVWILAFASSAFGAYLLARHWTDDRAASLVAGLIFAFCPFMFGHVTHLQVISAAGIPMTLLYFHRWLDSGRWLHLVLMTVCFVLQGLANGYYLLFLSLTLGLFLVYELTRSRRWRDRSVWVQLLAAAALAIASIGPLMRPYLAVRESMGFVRSTQIGASWMSYLATDQASWLYGATSRFGPPEGHLFPGLVPLLLATVGLVAACRLSPASSTPTARRTSLALLDGAAVLAMVAVFAASSTIRFSARRGHGTETVSWLEVSLLALCLVLILRRYLAVRWGPGGMLPRMAHPQHLYAVLLATAVLLSFGRSGPYRYLFRFVPGFDGLRVPARFAVFVMLALSLLAAFGVAAILQRLSIRGRWLLTAAIVLALGLEFARFPLPYREVPVGNDVPAVYRWLASQPGELAIAHYPYRQRRERLWMYFSTYHWKRLVNGYSGYEPPVHRTFRRESRVFPTSDSIGTLEEQGVRYVIFHPGLYRRQEWAEIRARLVEHESRLEHVDTFDGAWVYRMR